MAAETETAQREARDREELQMLRKLQVAGIMLTMVVGLAACSSNTKTTTTTTAKAPTTTTTSAAAATTTTKPAQVITISPSTGLKNNEMVKITGTGYPANESLGITECANDGNQTTANDCNLGGIGVTKATASGTVSATYAVVLGPFGGNHIVCTSAPGCIVSVSQEGSADPNAEATATIKFG